MFDTKKDFPVMTSERLNFESGLFFWVNLDIIYVGGSPLVGLATKFAHEKQIEGLVW